VLLPAASVSTTLTRTLTLRAFLIAVRALRFSLTLKLERPLGAIRSDARIATRPLAGRSSFSLRVRFNLASFDCLWHGR